MSEQNVTKCKVCQKLKLRIQDENFPNGRDKRWIGEEGKQWSGKTCPQCQVKIQAEKMRLKRAGK